MATMEKIFAGHYERERIRKASTNPFAAGIAWIGGELAPLHEAKVPMMDQGFLRSDLTYDVISVWDSRFFRFEDHMDRFETGCTKLRMRLPMTRTEIKSILLSMLAKSGLRDAYVMLICTRGLRGVRGNRAEDLENKLYMFIQPYLWVMSPEIQRAGTGSAVVTRTVRRTPPGSHDPTIKNLQWGDLTRGMWEAQDRDADCPFLGDGDGNLTEGSGYNICLIKDGVLYTPDRGVLEGVTRKTVMEACEMEGIEVRKEVVPVEMCYTCDECFTCTTAGAIMPITSIDGKKVGDGQVGPVTKRIWDLYWSMHYDDRWSFKVQYDTKAKL